MDYTPHTDEDIEQMLALIGMNSVSQLFETIPDDLRLRTPLQLPEPLAESELYDLMVSYAGRNRSTESLTSFAGGGAYDHYIPAVVRHLAYRAEFATSYTPYQPELSQGVLGALYEYQTMMCGLSGMEVSNASLYDGASALVEAVNLAATATKRSKIVVTEALNPNYRRVLETFGRGPGYQFTTARAAEGSTFVDQLDGAAALIVGQPNYFGVIEDLRLLADAAHGAGALLIVHFDPLAMGILEAPGFLGADVVTGEGQVLGGDLTFGGPYLGIFATKMEHVRRVPGRIVGATVDVSGKPGFVLTLQAREQHIRRERANSNVCTNQTLMAIAATVYLAWMGPRGLSELGEACHSRARHAADLLSSVPGCSLAFDRPFFKEFVLNVSGDASQVIAGLKDKGYLVGPHLSFSSAPAADSILVAVTERRSDEDIEGLAKALAEVVA